MRPQGHNEMYELRPTKILNMYELRPKHLKKVIEVIIMRIFQFLVYNILFCLKNKKGKKNWPEKVGMIINQG